MSPRIDDRTIRFVYSVARKYVRDPDAAWDVTQNALLTAHRKRDAFRGESAYSTWLYRIAATSALMYLRSQRRRRCEVPLTGEEAATPLASQVSHAPSPSADVAAREMVSIAGAAVAQMGELYPPVFWMRYGEGRTEKEISQTLCASLSAVKSRAHRALLVARHAVAATTEAASEA